MFDRIVLTLCMGALVGCSGWSKPPAAEQPLVATGQYAPPAQPTPRLRVAVPDLAVNGAKGTAADVDLMAVGSDELVSLLDASSRFDLTERNRLRQLLAEQGHADMIQPGRLVHPAAVHGFDFVLLGQITDLSVTKEPPPDKVSVAGVEQVLGVGNSYVPRLIVGAKVELWLVDAKSGAVDVAGKADFHHVGTPQSMGLQLSAEQLSQVQQAQLNPADTRHVFRLVLDDALRPMLPRIDRFAANLTPAGDSFGNSPSKATTNPTSQPRPSLSATVICPECGARVGADQEFCPNCGHKLK